MPLYRKHSGVFLFVLLWGGFFFLSASFKAALMPFIFKLRGCSSDDSFCK